MNRRGALVLLVLLAAAGFLRVHGLNDRGLWTDELFSASLTTRHPLVGAAPFRRIDQLHIADDDSFWTVKAADQTPPLFELLAKGSTHVFGIHEVGMRLPSVVAALLLILWLAFEAWRSRDPKERAVFLWTLLLASMSAALVWYGQEARAYSLGILFSGVLTTSWYRRWRTGWAEAKLPGWGELSIFILALYTHVNLIGLCAIYLATYGWIACARRDWRALARLAVVPAAFLPWLILSAHTLLFSARGGIAWLHLGRLEAMRVSFQQMYLLLGLGLVLVALALPLLQWLARRTSPADWRVEGVLVLTFLLYLVSVSQLAVHSGTLLPRHLVFVLPVCFLALGVGLARLDPRPVFVVATASMLLATQLIGPLRPDRRGAPPPEGYREAVKWVTSGASPGEQIVTTWAPNRDYYRFYLDRDPSAAGPWQPISVSEVGEAPALCSRLAHVTHVGVVAHGSHRALIETVLRSCGGLTSTGEIVAQGIIGQHWQRRANADAELR